MTKSFFNALMVFSTLMSAPSVFAERTKVTQYMYWCINYNSGPALADFIDVPKNLHEYIENENTQVIEDISYTKDSTQLKIRFSKSGTFYPSTAYLKFRAADSARIFKDLLTNGTNSLLLMYIRNGLAVDINTRSANLKADAMFVWWENDNRGLFTKVGELLGPHRSVEEQSYFDQLMIHLFGPSHLNKVNFIELTNKLSPTTSL